MRGAAGGVLLACALIAAMAIPGVLFGKEKPPVGGVSSTSFRYVRIGDDSLLERIERLRARTHRCQRQLGRSLSPVNWSAEASPSLAYRKWVARLWAGRARTYCRLAREVSSPVSAIRAVFGAEAGKALRVARCESGLNVHAVGGGGLYFGLFQQGAYSRQRYGFGWSALAQARAAKRHRDAEGWGPWPVCGRL